MSSARDLTIRLADLFLEKLQAARAALSHSHPGASDEEITARGGP